MTISANKTHKAANVMYDLGPLRLLIQGDEQQLKKLLVIFLQTFEQNLLALKKAVADNNARQIEFVAHKIKGSAGQLGAAGIGEIAHEIETMGKEARLENVRNELDALEESYLQIKPALEAEHSGSR